MCFLCLTIDIITSYHTFCCNNCFLNKKTQPQPSIKCFCKIRETLLPLFSISNLIRNIRGGGIPLLDHQKISFKQVSQFQQKRYIQSIMK